MVMSLLTRKLFEEVFKKVFKKWNTKCFEIKIKCHSFFLIKNMWGHFLCIQFSNPPDLSVSIRKCSEVPGVSQLLCLPNPSNVDIIFLDCFSEYAKFHSES